MSLPEPVADGRSQAGNVTIWKVLLVAFTAFAALYTAVSCFIVVVVFKQEFHAKTIILLNFTQFYFWIALSPLVFFFARRYSITRANWLRPVLFHVCASLPCALLEAAAAMTAFWLIALPDSRQLFPTLPRALDSIGNSFAQGVIIYWALVLAAHGLNYYQRYQKEELRTHQLRAQLSQAQLQALRMQLQPHFLFNTLHSINDLVLEDPEGATRMITRLGDFLRITLEGAAKPTVSLQQELEFLHHYLEIEKLRFHDRLRIEIDVEPEVLSAQVPNFILQPLVENALRHGVSARLDASWVRVRARNTGERLELLVQDNGPGFADRNSRNGLGLTNTQERLRHLYGEDQSVRVSRDGNSGARVCLSIPFTANPSSSGPNVPSSS